MFRKPNPEQGRRERTHPDAHEDAHHSGHRHELFISKMQVQCEVEVHADSSYGYERRRSEKIATKPH